MRLATTDCVQSQLRSFLCTVHLHPDHSHIHRTSNTSQVPVAPLFRVFLMTTASGQCHSGACKPADFPALDQTTIKQ